MKSSNLGSFGKGYYQLTSLNSKSGTPLLRGGLSEEDKRALTESPTGTPDYIAKALLLRTFFQVEDNLLDRAILKNKLANFIIKEKDKRTISFMPHSNINYAVIQLDEFAEELEASQEYPKRYFWIELNNEDKEVIGHILFHNKQVSIFSDSPIQVLASKESDIGSLFINTSSYVLMDNVFNITRQMNIFVKH